MPMIDYLSFCCASLRKVTVRGKVKDPVTNVC